MSYYQAKLNKINAELEAIDHKPNLLPYILDDFANILKDDVQARQVQNSLHERAALELIKKIEAKCNSVNLDAASKNAVNTKIRKLENMLKK